MNERELTVQQLDPIGGRAAQVVTISAAASIVIYAVVLTVLARDDIINAPVTVIALGSATALAILLVRASTPLRAPLTRTTHVAAIGLALIAVALEAAGSWGSNAFVRDDWGPLVVGLVSLALCPYRPAREVAAFGTVGALFTGLLVLVEAPGFVSGLPPFIYVVVAITPILALAYGGAAFASVLVQMMRRWQQSATSAVRAIANERREGITRSVQQDRVTILNRDVVPFFAEMLGRTDITESDRARANEIAGSIRSVMVAEVDRTWLEAVIDHYPTQLIGPIALHDEHHLAAAMSIEQRGALRAGIVAIITNPELTRGSLTLRFMGTRARTNVIVNAGFDRGVRSEIEPYLAVLRVVFDDLRISFSKPTLTVRFSYER